MGAIRPRWDQGRKVNLFFVDPDAGVGVRIAEEGPSQQRDGQDDERECNCVVHEFLKALGVPSVFVLLFQQINSWSRLQLLCKAQ